MLVQLEVLVLGSCLGKKPRHALAATRERKAAAPPKPRDPAPAEGRRCCAAARGAGPVATVPSGPVRVSSPWREFSLPSLALETAAIPFPFQLPPSSSSSPAAPLHKCPRLDDSAVPRAPSLLLPESSPGFVPIARRNPVAFAYSSPRRKRGVP